MNARFQDKVEERRLSTIDVYTDYDFLALLCV